MADEGAKDYEIGYCKPPKDSQFKPGQSGNPKGRPTDSRNVKHVLMAVSRENILLNENGESMIVSKQEALIRRLYADALKGDKRSAKLLLDIWTKWSGLFDR